MTHFRRLLVMLFSVIVLSIPCGRVTADDPTPAKIDTTVVDVESCPVRWREGDEIWIVSSRCLEICETIDLERLKCFSWSGQEWHTDDWRTVVSKHHQSGETIRTVIYLHGNRTDLHWSAIRGLQVFNCVLGTDLNRGPVRFIIWSWPTDPQGRRIKEYRDNAERSVWEGKILAEFLHELGGESTIGIIAYSFGAQTAVSATEISCCRAHAEGTSNRFAIACVAPAYQKPWSQVCIPFAGSEGCQSATLELSNSQDRALRVHRCLSHWTPRNYIWSTSVDEMSSSATPQEEWDIGELVGRRHDVVKYVSDPFAAQQLRETVLTVAVPPTESFKSETVK